MTSERFLSNAERVAIKARRMVVRQRRYAGLETQNELFKFLAHGDDKHQAWLQEAIWAFFKGYPRPEQKP